MRFKLGAKRDGTLVAAEASVYMEAGAYPENLVVDVPCTIQSVNGSAVVGN